MQLDERITIVRETETGDAYGEPEATREDVATVWGAFERETGRERIRAGRLEEAQGALARLRYKTAEKYGVTAADLFRVDGDLFRITGSREVGRKAYREFSCVQVR